MNAESSLRSLPADRLKVAAIIAVVLIHSAILLPFRPTRFDFSQLAIYVAANALRFCVPVFLFLWAFFLERSIRRSGERILLRRFRQLLLPFLFWTLVYFLLKADFSNMGPGELLIGYWTGYGWSGQYYFIILFQFLLLFPLLRRLVVRHGYSVKLIFILSVLFYLFVAYSGWAQHPLIYKLRDRMFFYWLPYVVLGIAHARANIFTLTIPRAICLWSVVLIPLEIIIFRPHTMGPYALASVFIASMALLHHALSPANRPLEGQSHPAMLQRLSGYTLGVFCINPLVILLGLRWLKPAPMQFPGCSLLCPLLAGIVVFLLSAGLVLLLKKLRLGFLVST